MTTLTVGYANLSPDYEIDGVADEVQVNQALAAASSGDTVLIRSLLLNIDAAIDHQPNVILEFEQAFSEVKATTGSITMIEQYPSSVPADGSTIIANNVMLNGNELDGVTGMNHRNSSVKHTITGILRIKNVAENFVNCHGSSVDFEDLRVTRSATTPAPAVATHGFDIDIHVAQDAFDVVIQSCDIDNYIYDAIKVENCNGFTCNDFNFKSDVIIGDTSDNAVDILFDDGIFDCVVQFHEIGAANTARIINSTFTELRGGIISLFDNGILSLGGNTFNGRNRWVFFNGTTWFSDTGKIVEESYNTHTNRPPVSGTTVFASHIDTGYSEYNKSPYITPAMANSNYETLCETPNIRQVNIRYALLSNLGDQSWSGNAAISFTVSNIYHLEGYPSVTTVTMAGASSDFLGTANLAAGSTISNVLFDGTGTSAGNQCIRLSTACILKGYNVSAKNFSNSTAGQFLEIRDASEAYFYGGSIEGFAGDNSDFGFATLCQSGATLELHQMKIKDNTDVGTKPACRWAAGSFGGAFGGLCKDNLTTALYTQDVDVVFYGLTFTGNTVDVEASVTLTNPIENCDFVDGEAGLDIGLTEVNYSVVVGGYTGSGGTGIVTTAQTYIDAANDDYNLVSGSSGLGVGIFGDVAYAGFNGTPWAQMSPDIGCCQSEHHIMSCKNNG